MHIILFILQSEHFNLKFDAIYIIIGMAQRQINITSSYLIIIRNLMYFSKQINIFIQKLFEYLNLL